MGTLIFVTFGVWLDDSLEAKVQDSFWQLSVFESYNLRIKCHIIAFSVPLNLGCWKEKQQRSLVENNITVLFSTEKVNIFLHWLFINVFELNLIKLITFCYCWTFQADTLNLFSNILCQIFPVANYESCTIKIHVGPLFYKKKKKRWFTSSIFSFCLDWRSRFRLCYRISAGLW